MGVLEIFDVCPADILWVSRRNVMGVLLIFNISLGDICGCPEDIRLVSWRYLVFVLEIYHRCNGDIGRCSGDIS